MTKFAKKTFIIGLVLLGIGILSLIAENTFYQYLDDEGFLHESLLMPLGAFSIIVGTLFLVFFIIQILLYLFRKNKS